MFAIDKERLESLYVLEQERKDGGFRSVIKREFIAGFVEKEMEG